MTLQDKAAKVLLFKALGNDVRLSILEELSRGALSVNEICKAIEEQQTRVSHELRCLTVCGFVNYRREGKNVLYSLNRNTVLPILRAADRHAGKFAERIKGCEMVSEAKRITVHELTV
jgi:ArsR family transcriptional regulator